MKKYIVHSEKILPTLLVSLMYTWVILDRIGGTLLPREQTVILRRLSNLSRCHTDHSLDPPDIRRFSYRRRKRRLRLWQFRIPGLNRLTPTYRDNQPVTDSTLTLYNQGLNSNVLWPSTSRLRDSFSIFGLYICSHVSRPFTSHGSFSEILWEAEGIAS